MLEYQWNDVLIPYWEKASKFAFDHGVDKICIEMHPGFCVYNPESLLKLRSAVGPVIGANFDPSHLFWQGIDPVQAILNLDEAIFHFHAKDTRINSNNVKVNGILDTKHYSSLRERAWVFATVGFGHGAIVWKGILDALRIVGYDYVLSIEHEDSLLSKKEGLEKAFNLLTNIRGKEKPEEMWWA
jgi:sugar phosphate isomerase/epimerase